MKKAFLLGATLLATFCLTGCDMIEGLLQGGQDLLNDKKQFKYDDFVVEIADDDFSFDYTKCTGTIDYDGKKSVIEYTYQEESGKWVYEETKKGSDGEPVTVMNYETFDVVSYTKSCPVTAALINEKVDTVYKFYTSKNGYEITYSYKNTEMQIEGEFSYNKQGLLTSSNEKQTDLKSVEAKIKKATYSYSK